MHSTLVFSALQLCKEAVDEKLVWRSPPLAIHGGSGTDAVLDLSIWNADVMI